jgi:hypothetical protein
MATFTDFILNTIVHHGCSEVESVEIKNDYIKKYVKDNYDPTAIFDESDLAVWAKDNGYIKEEKWR